MHSVAPHKPHAPITLPSIIHPLWDPRHHHLKVLTSLSKLPIRKRLRKDSTIQQLEQIPLARTTLSLEVPKDPALCFRLIRVQLHLNVAPDTVLPFLGPRVHAPRLAIARANVVAVGVAAVEAGARRKAVEVLGAVGESGGPFAD